MSGRAGGARQRWSGDEILSLHFTCCSFRTGHKTSPMAEQYTDLELAINTLVKNFHSASPTDADKLTAQEFQSMISKELPTMVRTAGDQEGLNKLLAEMNVEEGKGVTFKDFWRLVETLATAQFGMQSKEKQVKCVKCNLM